MDMGRNMEHMSMEDKEKHGERREGEKIVTGAASKEEGVADPRPPQRVRIHTHCSS